MKIQNYFPPPVALIDLLLSDVTQSGGGQDQLLTFYVMLLRIGELGVDGLEEIVAKRERPNGIGKRRKPSCCNRQLLFRN